MVPNFTPLDVDHLLKTHFPHHKRAVDTLFMVIGALTALVLILIFYVLLNK